MAFNFFLPEIVPLGHLLSLQPSIWHPRLYGRRKATLFKITLSHHEQMGFHVAKAVMSSPSYIDLARTCPISSTKTPIECVLHVHLKARPLLNHSQAINVELVTEGFVIDQRAGGHMENMMTPVYLKSNLTDSSWRLWLYYCMKVITTKRKSVVT